MCVYYRQVSRRRRSVRLRHGEPACVLWRSKWTKWSVTRSINSKNSSPGKRSVLTGKQVNNDAAPIRRRTPYTLAYMKERRRRRDDRHPYPHPLTNSLTHSLTRSLAHSLTLTLTHTQIDLHPDRSTPRYIYTHTLSLRPYYLHACRSATVSRCSRGGMIRSDSRNCVARRTCGRTDRGKDGTHFGWILPLPIGDTPWPRKRYVLCLFGGIPGLASEG